jgi:hypothetical protein
MQEMAPECICGDVPNHYRIRIIPCRMGRYDYQVY